MYSFAQDLIEQDSQGFHVSRLGGALFSIGSLSVAVVQWLLVWMFARFAGGPEAVGEYALVLSVATPVFTFAQLGLRTVYLSLRANYPWRSYITLRMAGLLLAVLILVLYFQTSSTVGSALWVAVLLSKVVTAYFDILQARIQRHGRLIGLGALNLANSLGTIAFAASALLIFGTVSAAVFASAMVSTAVAAGARRLSRQQSSERVEEGNGIREILRAGLPTTVAEFLAAFASYLPILVLSRIAGEALVGLFSAAAYLLTFANLSGAIAKNILITAFRRTLADEGVRALLRRSHRVVWGVGLVGCCAAPFVILLGDPVMRLVYGPGFGMSYGDLALLTVALIPIAPSYIYSTTINVLERFSSQAWIWVMALVLGLSTGVVCFFLGVSSIAIAFAVALAISWARFLGAFWLAMRLARN
ncbi:lipopolysaccharide biosynthesis protein [Paramicrobacterium agarici]|uniref:O-antigen/teichoic acid export membrane protein n=1 Tax=Paramicrobacterium agarici TaxID=630514 RepID=A0A2A9DX19_9MICO|nr:oligosaccharide flippase family protein [Microbacterium agarici]PFG30675.1 O-antigen/teichoic acid export membrane protein [Microbacterium agarici]